MLKWAVIPSCCRPAELAGLVSALLADSVFPVVIDTGYEPPYVSGHNWVSVIRDEDPERNVSRWWNHGLRYIAEKMEPLPEEYVIGMFNDDVVIPDHFVTGLAEALIEHDVDIAYPDQGGSGTQRYDWHRSPALPYRMSGYAFVLRGSAGIFGDETIKWWYGDDDVEWQARAGRGTLCVGGVTVQHLYPSSTTVGELAEQAERDRVTFQEKWAGRTPW